MNTLTATQQMFLVVGITLAVSVYLLFKLFKWRRSRKQNSVESFGKADASKSSAADAEHAQPSRLRSAWMKEPQAQTAAPADGIEEELPYAGTDDYQFGGITPVLAAMLPTSPKTREDLTRALRNAGDYTRHAWHNFAAKRYLGLMLPILVFGALLVVVPEEWETAVVIGLIVGPILGWALPALTLRNRAAERVREMEIAMPDMLDLLNMCVSQGMTVPSALGRVSKDIQPVYPALSKELQIVTEQARVGTLSQALTNFSRRVDVPEVHSFTSLLIQTEQMGTSVSDALIDYSDGMRENLRQRADEKANSATFKILFPTVLCLMPAVFLFLMGPALIELNRFFSQGGMNGLDQNATAVQNVTGGN